MYVKRETLDDRMKGYEDKGSFSFDTSLPLIVRVDGRGFSKVMKQFKKPYDGVLVKTMEDTMLEMCKIIPGCVYAYTQTDEINLIIYPKHTTYWFGYRGMKVCSVSAALATRLFNKYFIRNVENNLSYNGDYGDKSVYKKYLYDLDFDSRAFNIVERELENLIIWRQNFAEKNSVDKLAQPYLEHKDRNMKPLDYLKCTIEKKSGLVWDNYGTPYKWGSCCYKDINGKWVVDENMPRVKHTSKYIDVILGLN